MGKIKAGLLVCLLILSGTIGLTLIRVETVDAYVAYWPIRIDSNAEFSGYSSGGDGSQANPWIIENYDINGAGMGCCIYVGNTTDYFIIRNCYLHGASGVGHVIPYMHNDAGINLYSASNGTIINNTISHNWYGIDLRDTNNTFIHANNASGNSGIGVYIEMSSWAIVTNNTISNNAGYGLSLYEANNVTVRNNTFAQNILKGVTMGNTVTDCLFYHNNFFDNAISIGTGDNEFDNGYPSGGNYFSDYGGYDNYSGVNQDLPGYDLIGDTPYRVDFYYPLMEPVGGIPPVTNVEISPAFWNDGPISVECDASDVGSGLLVVGLFYRYSTDGIHWNNWTLYGNATPGDLEWDFPCYEGDGYYQFYSIGKDKAGYTEATKSAADAVCTFNRLPLISFVSPYGLQPGKPIQINVTDDNLDTVEYSIDGGSPQSFSHLYIINTTGWDEGTYEIKIQATDSIGNSSIATQEYVIDGTPPMIVSTYPEDSSVIKEHNPAITVLFSEEMDVSSVENSITFSSNFPEYRLEWEDNRTLTVVLDEELSPGETYAITISDAVDAYGNEMNEVTLSFSVKANYTIYFVIGIIIIVLLSIMFLWLKKRRTSKIEE